MPIKGITTLTNKDFLDAAKFLDCDPNDIIAFDDEFGLNQGGFPPPVGMTHYSWDAIALSRLTNGIYDEKWPDISRKVDNKAKFNKLKGHEYHTTGMLLDKDAAYKSNLMCNFSG